METFYRNEVKRSWSHLLQTLQEVQDLENLQGEGPAKATGGVVNEVNEGGDEDTATVFRVVQDIVNAIVTEEEENEREKTLERHLYLLRRLGGDLYTLGTAFDQEDRNNSINNVNVVDELGRATDGSKRRPLMEDEITAILGEGRLEHATVVFCTLATAGSSLMKRFVTYVDTLIVDEAAQALEAELVIPLALGGYGFEKSDPKTASMALTHIGVRNVVLIGDPRQLPAIITNKQTEKSGRGLSCMQRLMEEALHRVPVHLLNTQYRYVPLSLLHLLLLLFFLLLPFLPLFFSLRRT